MKREDPKRKAGLMRIKQWVEKALAGEVELPSAETALEPDGVWRLADGVTRDGRVD